MSDAKISALTQLSATPASGDMLAIVDVSDTTDAGSGTTKYITVYDLTQIMNARTVTLTNKTIDGDDNTISDIAMASTKLVAGTGLTLSTDTLNADSASTSAVGVMETATAAEVNTGTDAGRAVSPDSLAGSNAGLRYIQSMVFYQTDSNVTGDGKAYFHIPAGMSGMDLVEVHAENITAGTTGTEDIQIYNFQVGDMLSTKITIDTTETGSDTAATPAVIDTSNDNVSTNDLLRVDVDAVHSGTAAKGLIVTLGFRIP